MRALVHHRYGPADLLEIQEAPRPRPTDEEVLVRVHAASVNPADWRLMRADPVLVRLMGMGFFAPKKQRLGADVAGVVVEVGAKVTRLRPGDEVFGVAFERGSGSFAEYATTHADDLAPKPRNLDFVEAAAAPLAGTTALLALESLGASLHGMHVLIHGASGGVGTFAVQLAKLFGATVTAVTSTRNVEFVRELGADEVLDYMRGDVLGLPRKYDAILGIAGYRPLGEYARSLTTGGEYVCIGGANRQLYEGLFLGPLRSLLSRKTLRALSAAPTSADFERLGALLESAAVRPVVERRYPFAGVAEALAYVEGGHARGKVVVEVHPSTLARPAPSPRPSALSRESPAVRRALAAVRLARTG